MEVMGGYITVRDVSKPKGESYRVAVERGFDLADLKSAISKATGFAVDDLRLTFNGHTLEHELQPSSTNKNIGAIGLLDDPPKTVHMLLHPKAQKQAIIAAAFKAFVRRAAAASALCVPSPARPVPKLTSLASGRGRDMAFVNSSLEEVERRREAREAEPPPPPRKIDDLLGDSAS